MKKETDDRGFAKRNMTTLAMRRMIVELNKEEEDVSSVFFNNIPNNQKGGNING